MTEDTPSQYVLPGISINLSNASSTCLGISYSLLSIIHSVLYCIFRQRSECECGQEVSTLTFSVDKITSEFSRVNTLVMCSAGCSTNAICIAKPIVPKPRSTITCYWAFNTYVGVCVTYWFFRIWKIAVWVGITFSSVNLSGYVCILLIVSWKLLLVTVRCTENPVLKAPDFCTPS